MTVKHLNTGNFDAEVNAAPLTIVDFWAVWCGPCRMLAPTIEKIAEQYDGRAQVAKVNIDEEPALAQKFGVMSIPTVVFLKNGQEFERRVGVMPAQAYTSVLDENL